MPTQPENLRESEVSAQAKKIFEASGCVLFRNNIGTAKMGPFWVRFGVGGKGGADHIGYLPVRVTPEMVGHTVAIFVAPEIKRSVKYRHTPEQEQFRDSILAAGEIAGFVHSWQEARGLINQWFLRFQTKTNGLYTKY